MTDPNTNPELVADVPAAEGAAATPADTVADSVSAAETEALRLVAEQKDKYLRLFAEFENFRKRSVRERQEAESKGMSFVVAGLLEALDDLGRVAHLDAAVTPAQAIVDGVAMVEKKVLKSLAGHGLVLVNPEGEKFDPAVHEALSAMPAALPEEDERVAQVYQVGYTFNGQLLRPARVVVKQWHG
ncbi:MAG: nucleotide exchange factor GrpE [Gemmatimonadota bacterium]|nr:nucleotide exchange factor GrpE [Gemmatimonadota bacterium]